MHMNDPKPSPLGVALKQARGELSQNQLASKAGLDASQISMLESGRRVDAYFTTVAKIAKVLNISLDSLADGILATVDFESTSSLAQRIASIEERLGTASANDEFTLEPLRENEVDLGLVDSSQPMCDQNLAAMPTPLRLARLETVIREMADQLRDQGLVNELLLGQAGIKMPLADNTVSIARVKKSKTR